MEQYPPETRSIPSHAQADIDKGLFLQSYRGARQRGTVGFVQGIGKGLGGFVLKDLAAIFGPFAYTMKSFHKGAPQRLTTNGFHSTPASGRHRC